MMTEQPIAPVDETVWYRNYWQELATKFLFGFFAGVVLLGSGFLVALYFVVRSAALAAMLEYAAIQMR